jgi:hypothetical protein
VKSDRLIELIRNFKTTPLYKNNKGEFGWIKRHFLVVAAKRTTELKIPGKFAFDGWYRLFDDKHLGETEKVMAGLRTP